MCRQIDSPSLRIAGVVLVYGLAVGVDVDTVEILRQRAWLHTVFRHLLAVYVEEIRTRRRSGAPAGCKRGGRVVYWLQHLWRRYLVGLARHHDIVEQEVYLLGRKLKYIVGIECGLVSGEGEFLPLVGNVKITVVNGTFVVVAQCHTDDALVAGFQTSGSELQHYVSAEFHLRCAYESSCKTTVFRLIHA